MKTTKKLTAIILCIIMAITVIPMSAFATDEAYIEIKFADEGKENILLGETEELYVDYFAGNCEDYEIVWHMSNTTRWKTEYVTDEETGLITGAIIEGTYTGYFTLTVEIISSEGDKIASTERRIWVVEPDNRTIGEKISDFFRDTFFGAFFITGFIILPLIAAPIIEPPYYIYLAIKYLVEEVF